MPVLATDIKSYQSANMPEDDVGVSGGAIDPTGIVEFTAMAANDTLEALSDNAGDTMLLTITGRDAGGAVVNEALALNGLTVVPFPTNTLERLLKAGLASGPTGTVTIRRSGGGATVATIAPGKTSVRRLFYDSASEAGPTTRFEKIFIKNENGVSTLSNAAVKLTADPSASIRIGVAATKDDTGSVANRKATPAGITFVDDGVSQAVPAGALAANESIGVWAELQRAGGAPAIKDTFDVEMSGTSA